MAVEITRRCPLACRHCFVPADSATPPAGEVRRVLREAAAAGCRKVIITGGEPLLRDDLEEITRVCADSGMLADLNSTLITLTEERARALRDAGLTEASVSLYGSPEAHGWLTGNHEAFAAALQGITILRGLGVTVDVHCALTDAIVEHLPSLARLCGSLGVASLSFFTIMGERSSREGESSFPLHRGRAMAAIGELRENSAMPVGTVGLGGRGAGECIMGAGIVGLDASLRLLPCLLGGPGPGVSMGRRGFAEALGMLQEEVQRGAWRPCLS